MAGEIVRTGDWSQTAKKVAFPGGVKMALTVKAVMPGGGASPRPTTGVLWPRKV